MRSTARLSGRCAVPEYSRPNSGVSIPHLYALITCYSRLLQLLLYANFISRKDHLKAVIILPTRLIYNKKIFT